MSSNNETHADFMNMFLEETTEEFLENIIGRVESRNTNNENNRLLEVMNTGDEDNYEEFLLQTMINLTTEENNDESKHWILKRQNAVQSFSNELLPIYENLFLKEREQFGKWNNYSSLCYKLNFVCSIPSNDVDEQWDDNMRDQCFFAKENIEKRATNGNHENVVFFFNKCRKHLLLKLFLDCSKSQINKLLVQERISGLKPIEYIASNNPFFNTLLISPKILDKCFKKSLMVALRNGIFNQSVYDKIIDKKIIDSRLNNKKILFSKDQYQYNILTYLAKFTPKLVNDYHLSILDDDTLLDMIFVCTNDILLEKLINLVTQEKFNIFNHPQFAYRLISQNGKAFEKLILKKYYDNNVIDVLKFSTNEEYIFKLIFEDQNLMQNLETYLEIIFDRDDVFVYNIIHKLLLLYPNSFNKIISHFISIYCIKNLCLIQLIAEHPDFRKETFDEILDCEIIEPVVLKYILHHKYCDKKFLTKYIPYLISSVDIGGESQKDYSNILLLVKDSPNFVNNFFGINVGIHKDSILLYYALYCPKIFRTLEYSNKMLYIQNNYGNTILHNLVINNKKIAFNTIIKRLKKKDEKLIGIVNKNEETVIDLILDLKRDKFYFKLLKMDIFKKNFKNIKHKSLIFQTRYWKMIIDSLTPEELAYKNENVKNFLHGLIHSDINADKQLKIFKYLLNSGKCTNELFISSCSLCAPLSLWRQNCINGEYLLRQDPRIEFVITLLESEFCTKELLELKNENNFGILESALFVNSEDICDIVLNHGNVTYKVIENLIELNFVGKILNPSVDIFGKYQINIYEKIFYSKLCNITVIETLLFNIIHRHANFTEILDIIQLILNSDYNLKSFFARFLITIFDYMNLSTYYIFVIFFNYMNQKLDKTYVQRFVDYMFRNLKNTLNFVNKLEYIKNSQYWAKDILYCCDQNNENILFHISYSDFQNVDSLLQIFNDLCCDEKLVMTPNNDNELCISNFDLDTLTYFMNTCFMTEIFEHQNNFGNTCLHTFILNKKIDLVLYILERRHHIAKQLLKIQNNYKQNILMIAITISDKLALTLMEFILENNLMDNELLYQIDYKGNTLLLYLCRYNRLHTTVLFLNKCLTKELYEKRNFKMKSCIIIACKYAESFVMGLLEFTFFNTKLLTIGNKKPTALTVAAKYQPDSLRIMAPYLSETNYTYTCDADENDHLLVACTYNSLSVKHIMEYYISECYLNMTFMKPYLEKAAECQPDALKYILDKLEHVYIPDDIVDIAFMHQPKALKYLLKTGKLTNSNMWLYKINQLYPEIKTINDIDKIKLTDYDNIVSPNGSKNVCNICCVYEKKIVFSCNHMACVVCAFKMNNCPSCRQQITSKNILFND